MKILRSDYHTHTPLCMHAEGEPEAFVERALELGLSEYGIADHAPMPPEREPFDEWRMLTAELPAYIKWVERAKAAAQGTSLTIRVGMECDWVPGIEAWTEKLRDIYDWDYLIGSIHYLGKLGTVDDAIYSNKCLSGSVEKDWELYWRGAADMVNSGLFDIYGHLDLVKIYNRRPTGELMTYYEATLDALAAASGVVELNAAGWHKPCAEQYPSCELISEILRRGIPMCINSDAHAPAQVSRNWEQALELLQSCAPAPLMQQRITTSNGASILALTHGSL